MNDSKQFGKSKGKLLNLGHIITMPIASIMGLFFPIYSHTQNVSQE